MSMAGLNILAVCQWFLLDTVRHKKTAKLVNLRVIGFFCTSLNAYLAESEGFEPSIRFRIHTFQACAFDHSTNSPYVYLKIRDFKSI